MRYHIESRLLKLERLLEQLGTSSPRFVPGESVDLAALTRLRALAPRLRLLTAEVSGRERSADWDSADAISARLLLSDLTEGIHAYRTAVRGLDIRLNRAAAALRDISGIIESQAPEPD